MWIIVEALLVFGCAIYMTISIMSYVSQSGLLSTQLDDLKASIQHKQNRLDDYRIKAEQLQETVPALKTRASRLQQWITALKRQKNHLSSKNQIDADQPTRTTRDAAIRRSIASVQKRKG